MLNLLQLFAFGRVALVAENLFLRKQLALFQERIVRPRRAKTTTLLAKLARLGSSSGGSLIEFLCTTG